MGSDSKETNRHDLELRRWLELALDEARPKGFLRSLSKSLQLCVSEGDTILMAVSIDLDIFNLPPDLLNLLRGGGRVAD